MATEPTPHVTTAGRWMLYTAFGLVGVIALAIMVNGCIRRPRTVVERPYGQGYDSPAGYNEPDHGFLYYWMWTQVLRSDVRPTYHIYVPPTGAPVGFRPWQQRDYYRDSAGRFTKRPAPSSGGFTTTPKPAWSSSPIYTPKSAPSYTAPKPSSGGFTAPRPSSGGFKSSPNRPSSGGFSSAPRSAPSRPSSGGFRR